MSGYIGRFAPSPTGPLHAGSMVAALASWLDAKAHQGTWIVRIEDLDQDRCVKGIDQFILQQLTKCQLLSTEPVQWQSKRVRGYESAFETLNELNLIYPCHCTRAKILSELLGNGGQLTRNQSKIYPGTCRSLEFKDHEDLQIQGAAWRFKVTPGPLVWEDRRLGIQHQDVSAEVGDFIIKRSDCVWAYQLSVVVDDAQSKITHIVRGADLVDNTARQIQLQKALGYPVPKYLHTQLLLGPNGEKLSKQNGAAPANTSHPLECLNTAAQTLGLQMQSSSVSEALAFWSEQWLERYP